MRISSASFNGRGSPILKFALEGVHGKPIEFEGILDTGFSGFIMMPLLKVLPLGLVLAGTTDYVLADGQKQNKLYAIGIARLGERKAHGEVALEMNANHILVGMQFIRSMQAVLVVRDTSCDLHDEATFKIA